MATKAAHTQFNRSVAAYLQSIGAELKKFTVYYGEWILNTLAGDLYVNMREPERSEVFSIFCMFDEPIRAEQHIPNEDYNYSHLNRYSGKWNFHSYDAKELLEEFKEQVQPLLIKTLTT